jgi:excisionase family DNA binding protein
VKLLTLEQACETVQLSPWTLRRAIARGELEAYKIAGRVRMSEAALQQWIKEAAIASPHDRAVLRDCGMTPLRTSTDHFRQLAKVAASTTGAKA